MSRPRFPRPVLASLLLALAACTSAPPAASPSVVAGEWRLVELYGEPVAPVGGAETPTLRLQEGEARATGNTGCNRFSAAWRTDGEGPRFSAPVSTRRACVDPAANAREQRYLQALTETTSMRIEDGRLLLLAGERVVARLEAASGS